jgi:hypothetical protein
MLFGVRGDTARHVSLRRVVHVRVDLLHPSGTQPARHILFVLDGLDERAKMALAMHRRRGVALEDVQHDNPRVRTCRQRLHGGQHSLCKP